MVVSALLFVSCPSSLAQTLNQSLDDRKILVESFVISGTQAVDSAELAEITNSMAASTFNDDTEELRERIRAQFQDRGYFKAELQKLDIKVIDPLASPKPVRLEAQVSEGPRCRALAHLGVARANALQSRTSQGADADAARLRALAAYEDFLTLWKDADPDIPVLKQAKAEYAKLK